MKKLTPITKGEAMAILASQRVSQELSEVRKAIPSVRDGRDGRDGVDGVTTTVVKEVLANKEALLDKEEFEEFKEYMVRAERDIRDAIAGTHNYFGGGGGSSALQGAIVNVINVSTTSTISANQLLDTKINVVLVNTAGITVTLPPADETKLVLVQKNFTGDGDCTVIRS